MAKKDADSCVHCGWGIGVHVFRMDDDTNQAREWKRLREGYLVPLLDAEGRERCPGFTRPPQQPLYEAAAHVQ